MAATRPLAGAARISLRMYVLEMGGIDWRRLHRRCGGKVASPSDAQLDVSQSWAVRAGDVDLRRSASAFMSTRSLLSGADCITASSPHALCRWPRLAAQAASFASGDQWVYPARYTPPVL